MITSGMYYIHLNFAFDGGINIYVHFTYRTSPYMYMLVCSCSSFGYTLSPKREQIVELDHEGKFDLSELRPYMHKPAILANLTFRAVACSDIWFLTMPTSDQPDDVLDSTGLYCSLQATLLIVSKPFDQIIAQMTACYNLFQSRTDSDRPPPGSMDVWSAPVLFQWLLQFERSVILPIQSLRKLTSGLHIHMYWLSPRYSRY